MRIPVPRGPRTRLYADHRIEARLVQLRDHLLRKLLAVHLLAVCIVGEPPLQVLDQLIDVESSDHLGLNSSR